MKLAVFSLIVLALAGLVPASGECSTWYIKPDGTGDKPTIQEAFDVAVSGDIILLADGTFSGPGNSEATMIFPASGRITLTSENGAALTTIDCTGLSGISISANNTLWCTVSGIRFINTSGTFSGLMVGFTLMGPSADRTFTTVEDNALENLLLIRGTSDGRCYVLNNQLSNCLINCAVKKAVVEGNAGSGRVYAPGDSVGVMSNTFAGMTADAIIACENGAPSNVYIEGNHVSNNVTNRSISLASASSSLDLVIRDNVLKNNVDGGGSSRAGLFLIVSASTLNGSIQGNVVGGNGVPAMFLTAASGIPSLVAITGNTFSENAGGANLDVSGALSLDFSNNIVAFGTTGVGITCSGDVTLSCNDIYGNPGGNGLCGTDGGGNFSRDPIFCGNLGSCNYTLRSISPCAPGNHPDAVNCGLIGARPVACSVLGDICWHVDDFFGLGSPYAPLFGAKSLWCGARPSVSPPFDTYVSLPGYGNDWNPSFESIEFPTAGDITVKFTARRDLEPGDVAWLEYLDKDNAWNAFPPLTGSDVSWEYHMIAASELAGRIKLRFRFTSDSAGSDEDGVNTDGAVVIDSLLVTDSVLGVIDYQDFETELVGATQTDDGHWYCANPPTVVLSESPVQFLLYQAFPNPFNPSTTIRYAIGRVAAVSLVIYDVAGRTVRVLVDGQASPGMYEAHWDGTDSRGARVASGVYLYRLRAAEYSDTKKMLLLK